MKTKFVRLSRKTKPIHGNKHAGIYGKQKDISPTPQKVYMSMTWNIPVAYANALQEKYPGMSLASAIKILVMSNLTPIETKEIS